MIYEIRQILHTCIYLSCAVFTRIREHRDQKFAVIVGNFDPPAFIYRVQVFKADFNGK